MLSKCAKLFPPVNTNCSLIFFEYFFQYEEDWMWIIGYMSYLKNSKVKFIPGKTQNSLWKMWLSTLVWRKHGHCSFNRTFWVRSFLGILYVAVIVKESSRIQNVQQLHHQKLSECWQPACLKGFLLAQFASRQNITHIQPTLHRQRGEYFRASTPLHYLFSIKNTHCGGKILQRSTILPKALVTPLLTVCVTHLCAFGR